MPCRIAPVEPSRGINGYVNFREEEDHPRVRPPRTAQVDGSVSGDEAADEGEPSKLRLLHPLLGCEGAAPGVGDRVQMARLRKDGWIGRKVISLYVDHVIRSHSCSSFNFLRIFYSIGHANL